LNGLTTKSANAHGYQKVREAIQQALTRRLALIPIALMTGATNLAAAQIKWNQALDQPTAWYAAANAARIADNLRVYQRESGGWPKNIDMALVMSEAERQAIVKEKPTADATIDNGATYSQLIFLARVFSAHHQPLYKDSFLKGLDYLLRAQYQNGGWPQYFPLREGYYSHITFNDDAMIGVMSLLRDVAKGKPDYVFVDKVRRERAAAAVEKGIECILKTQVIAQGRRTVWCAQHDEVTLAPAPARTYEHISLSGMESVGIVRFLMGIEHPGPDVIAAIEDSIEWFRTSQIDGLRWVERRGKTVDRVVIADPDAPPLWARFYQIETNRPIFSGRDGIIKYNVAEIESERRNGYRWYTDAPARLLHQDYPAWVKRVSRSPAALK